MGPALIQDYGIIGNGRSAALVGRSGSIDWLCWPRFDSPSLFAALLDRARGGHFPIAPTAPFTRDARLRATDSNVLVTTFTTADGEVAPDRSHARDVRGRQGDHAVPRARDPARLRPCVRGAVELRVEFQPRPDYARRVVPIRATRAPRVPRSRTARASTRCAPNGRSRSVGEAGRRRPLHAARRRARDVLARFDHAAPAVLPPLGAESGVAVAAHDRVVAALGRAAATTTAPTARAVVRSVLALKLLNYAPSGAIVAAPTTSLPERIGGDLNWDYRFCWVRDAALTVSSLSDLGYEDEASAFFDWLLHSTRLTRPALRVLYDVYGGVPAAEATLDHLQGHLGLASGPHPQRAPPASCSSTATASWSRRSRRCAGAAAAWRARRRR